MGADLIATKQKELACEAELEKLLSSEQLDFQKIIAKQQEVDGYKKGAEALEKLGEELGLKLN